MVSCCPYQVEQAGSPVYLGCEESFPEAKVLATFCGGTWHDNAYGIWVSSVIILDASPQKGEDMSLEICLSFCSGTSPLTLPVKDVCILDSTSHVQVT